MCRRKELPCLCLICFGAGLLLGNWIHSWLWCGCGGAALIALGWILLRSR